MKPALQVSRLELNAAHEFSLKHQHESPTTTWPPTTWPDAFLFEVSSFGIGDTTKIVCRTCGAIENITDYSVW